MVLRVLLVVVVLALIVFPASMRLATDWYWFQEIGYQRVFTTEILTKVLLFVVVGLLSYVFLIVNVRIARRGGSPVNVFSQQIPQNLVELIERLPRLTTPAALVFSFLAGISASAAWMTALQFLNGAPFGTTDPVFNRDIGFYTRLADDIDRGVGVALRLRVSRSRRNPAPESEAFHLAARRYAPGNSGNRVPRAGGAPDLGHPDSGARVFQYRSIHRRQLYGPERAPPRIAPDCHHRTAGRGVHRLGNR
jgi:hypothetical protein